MMKHIVNRGVLGALCAAGALLAAPVPAAAQQVTVGYDGAVGMGGWPVGAAYTVAIRDRAGGLRQYCAGVFSASGGGTCRVRGDLGGRIMPGDSVTVTSGGQDYAHTVAKLVISTIDPRRNRIAGRVFGGRAGVVVSGNQRHYDDGWEAITTFSIAVTPDAEGRFSVTTTPFDLSRDAYVSLRYAEGAPVEFTVHKSQYAPQLTVDFGAEAVDMNAAPFRHYRLLLIDRRGRVKGSLLGGTGVFGGLDAYQPRFLKRGGRTVRIAAGDRIRVIGRWGFGGSVARLDVAADPATDAVHVQTRPETMVYIYGQRIDQLAVKYFEQYRRSDADGAVDIAVAGDVVPGDYVVASIYDAAGNWLTRRIQVFP